LLLFPQINLKLKQNAIVRSIYLLNKDENGNNTRSNHNGKQTIYSYFLFTFGILVTDNQRSNLRIIFKNMKIDNHQI